MPDKISLSELQVTIRNSLYLAFPDFYWVIAEISEMKVNSSGHCYLELIEKDDAGIKAKARAVIWRNKFPLINALFENETGTPLRGDTTILCKAKVEYHEIYGLSLVISDIDPSYTVGEMAIKRQKIIKQLEEDGVINMNKELTFPLLPKRIAIISSSKAAGYTDFVTHINTNTFGYSFSIVLFEAIMQGSETEKSVVAALDEIAAVSDNFDVVVIIRGGGSVSDLSWFDNYNIAYYITQFPLPVLTGIGHEKDVSITDMVAFKAAKTPTAVADYLIDSFSKIESLLMESSNDLKMMVSSIIEEKRHAVEMLQTRVLSASKMLISTYDKDLSALSLRVITSGKNYIMKISSNLYRLETSMLSASRYYASSHRVNIDHQLKRLNQSVYNYLAKSLSTVNTLEESLNKLDPERVIARGYTLTSMNGTIITSSSQLKRSDTITTTFRNGAIKSRVIEIDSENK